MPVLGNLALKLSLVCSAVALLAALRWAGGRRASRRTFVWAYHAMTAALVLASAHLLIAILGHDFRFSYVVSYTSRDLPLLYLISAFWAGQSGTFLLWALMAALLGYALFRRTSWEPARVMTAYVPTIGFLLVLMLDPAGNPFRLVPRVPPDGNGLNPLLQDPWMASHPPVIFLGYAAMAVPAVLALVALLTGSSKEWLRPALRWSLLSFASLGAGIILGGFWAYRVLGWGGYWGWDPVENASLVPWLVIAALLHGLLVQRATGALPKTNLALALGGYLLVIYATFLTRSGVLADFSVHSFPEGGIYRILVAVMLVVAGVSGWALYRGRRASGAAVPVEASWPFVLSSIIVTLVIAAGLVLIGTSWPILSQFWGQPGALTASFYNRVTLPLVAVLLGLLGVGPFLSWMKRPWPALARRVAPVVAVAVAGTAGAWLLGGRGAGALVVFFTALAALAANLVRLVETARAGVLHTGAPLAHIGFALMFVGVVGSSAWGVGQKAELPLGRGVEVLGRTLTFRGHVDGSEPQDRWRVDVRDAGGRTTRTEVWMFQEFVGRQPQTFHRPGILRGVARDLYVAPAGLRTEEARRQLELERGRPLDVAGASLTFEGFERPTAETHGMTVHARVVARRGEETESAVLPLSVVDGRMRGEPVELRLLPGMRLTLERMAVEQGIIRVRAEDPAATPTTVLTVDVSTKPLVGFLWAGTVLLLLGSVVAVVRRVREEAWLAAVAGPARRTRGKPAKRGPATARAARASQSRP